MENQEKEKSDIVTVRGKNAIISWMRGEEIASDVFTEALDDLDVNNSNAIDLFLAAVSSRRLVGLVDLFNNKRKIEDIAYNEVYLNSLDPQDLINLLRITSSNMDKDLEYLKEFGSKRSSSIDVVATVVEEDTDEKRAVIEEFDKLPPEQKKRVLAVLKYLSKEDESGE